MRLHYIIHVVLCSLFLFTLAQPSTSQVDTDCTNESWINIGAGLPGAAIASTEMNGSLYVLYRSDPADTSRFQISAWDGSVWTPVTSFNLLIPVAGVDHKTFKFQAFQGSLYLAGEFTMNGDDNLKGFVRWNGSAWSFAGEMAGTKRLKAVGALCLHNGNLIAMAAFIEGIDSYEIRIMQYDGSSWTYVGGEDSQKNTYLGGNSLASWNGDLYLGGISLHLGGSAEEIMVVRWDGKTWSRAGGMNGLVTYLFVYNNALYAVGIRPFSSGISPLARWDGTTWTAAIPQPNRWSRDARATVHNGQVYMYSIPDTGIYKMRNIERFDGTAWHIVSNFDGNIHFLASYKGSLLAGGAFANSCGTPVANFAAFCNEQNCGRISGKVFYDRDANCTQDAGDKGLARRIVTIEPGPNYAVTDAQGNYSRYLTSGDYTVAFQQTGHWNRVCPADPGTHSVTIAGTASVSDINFGAQPIPGIQDLRASIVSGPARQGRQLVYVITYENAGTIPMNGTVRFSHDPILTFDSANPAHSRYAPNIIEWNFTNLQVDEIRTIKVYTTVPVSAPMNADICGQIRIDPQVNNAGNDDRDSICITVTGSYDPNDISVTPFGIENSGVISPEESRLTYMVRFQNTGNDTAFKVVVTDKLSTNLDISSIKLGAASHPFSFSIDKDNLLTWTFDNILLPDSTASQTNSNGFFKFSVNIKSGLAAGTQITNFADIYFDYNAPVRTNTVMSIIGASLAVGTPVEPLPSLAMYPNPTRSMLHLNGKLRSGAVVKLRNLLGQEVARYTHNGTSLMTIDASALPAGTYLLEAETADGTVVQRVTVMK